MTPAHLAQHYVGNWEIGKLIQVHTSQFSTFSHDSSTSGSALFGKLGSGYSYILPNFPQGRSPDGSALFGKLGNWEMVKATYFKISEVVLTWILKSTNINSSISVSISTNIRDSVLCYDKSAKPRFINTPCVYKQLWA